MILAALNFAPFDDEGQDLRKCENKLKAYQAKYDFLQKHLRVSSSA